MRSFLSISIVLFFMLACNNQNKSTIATKTAKTDTCEVIFAVEGMSCTGCEKTIESKITSLDDVKSVKASHINKTTTIVFNTLTPDTSLIKNAISDVGYKVVGVTSIQN